MTKLDRIGSITKEQLVAWANEKLGTENYGIIYKRQGEDPSVQKIAKPALTPIQMNRDTQSAFDRNSKFDGNSDRTRIRGFQPRYGDFQNRFQPRSPL